jgi:hypothetical protein
MKRLLLSLVLATSLSSCAWWTNNFDSKRAVACARANIDDPALQAAAMNCLVGAASTNYIACLDLLVEGGQFTFETLACYLRAKNVETNRLNLSGDGTSATELIRTRSADYLELREVSFK